jgi:fructokinase
VLRIGIDLGGTKIEGIALDGGREVARLRVDTPRDDYPETLDAVTSLVTRLEDLAGARGTVGLGIPGAISPTTGLVKNANSVWLIGRPLLSDLQRQLGRQVRIANDANCFAVSEASDGAGAGADVVFGAIVGTGTGAGIAVRGQVLTGLHAIAGEWGHNPLPWPAENEHPGFECYCGKRGCVETFLSGPGLAADHQRRTGRRLLPREIVARAAAGDALAEQTLVRYERRMARALAAIINTLDPDVIVLGGGMSNIARLYANVPRLWGAWVFAVGPDEAVRTPLLPARHGDSSGVRGAAWLWPETPCSGGL